MSKSVSRVPKAKQKSDPMKTKTGKPKLASLSFEALQLLKKTTKPKNMAKVDKEIVKRIKSIPASKVPQPNIL